MSEGLIRRDDTLKHNIVNRGKLERALRKGGCYFLRRGGNHDIWQSPLGKIKVPRHKEIPLGTARQICNEAGIPLVK